MERRTNRSADSGKALQCLIEAVSARSEVRALALVDDHGRVLASHGRRADVRGLARIAGPAVRRESCEVFAAVTEGTDFLGRGIGTSVGTLYLAALGTRLRRMPETVRAVTRILGSAAPA